MGSTLKKNWQTYRGQKSHDRSGAMSKSFLPSSLTLVTWFIASTGHHHHQGILSRGNESSLWNFQTQTTGPVGSGQLTDPSLQRSFPVFTKFPRHTRQITLLLHHAPYSADTLPYSAWGFSPSWKCQWKGPYFGPASTSCAIRRTSCMPSQKRCSSAASESGWTVAWSMW